MQRYAKINKSYGYDMAIMGTHTRHVNCSDVNFILFNEDVKKIYLDDNPNRIGEAITHNELMTSLLSFYMGDSFIQRRSDVQYKLDKRKRA